MTRLDAQADLPSNRSFGWLFSAIFTLIGMRTLLREGSVYPLIFALAGVTAVVTAFRPVWLAPFNRAWMAFAGLLQRVVSPLVLGVIFFAVFAPVGIAMRAAGRDAMKRRFEAHARTYWVEREPPGPAAESLKDQF
ncbi:MAG: SxtJ family membrane protein [Burkholderiales bacterium]